MEPLKVVSNEVRPLKPPVDESTLVHKQVLRGPFWQKIPAYANVSEAEFLDHKWQAKHSITNVAKLMAALGPLGAPGQLRTHQAEDDHLRRGV